MQDIEIALLKNLYQAHLDTSDGYLKEERLVSLVGFPFLYIKQILIPLEENQLIKIEHASSYKRDFTRYKLTTKGVEYCKKTLLLTPENALDGDGHGDETQNLHSLKFQISPVDNVAFSTRLISHTLFGESLVKNPLPYSTSELFVILKLLSSGQFNPKYFTEEQIVWIKQEKLFENNNDISAQLHKNIGDKLYRSLFSGALETSLQASLNQARIDKKLLSVQLRFDEDAVGLAMFPWELIFSRKHLLLGGFFEITRYISYSESATSISAESPMRLLYLQPRPNGLAKLDFSERNAVKRVIQSSGSDNIKIDFLKKNTFQKLIEHLQNTKVHMLHFDGHGVFGWKCTCGAINHPLSLKCKRQILESVCDTPKYSDVKGYLAFESERGETDWISSDELGYVFSNRELVLAMISACRSSNIASDNMFNSIAPSLIQAGIPAVVAMQLPVLSTAATQFAQGFYSEFSKSYSLVHSVNMGRMQMLRSHQWFIPTLYLRNKEDQTNIHLNRRH